jgi:hypothetical protein
MTSPTDAVTTFGMKTSCWPPTTTGISLFPAAPAAQTSVSDMNFRVAMRSD